MDELYELVLKIANQFYVGNDSEAWNDFVQLINILSSKLSGDCPDAEHKVLLSIVKDLETVERLKVENNILDIADFLIGIVFEKLKEFIEVN